MQLKGLDEMAKELDKLASKADALDGTHEVPLSELFPAPFMRRRTSFQTIDAMMDASGYDIETLEDFDSIPEGEWDQFVAERTQFSTWEEMESAAVEKWVSAKLGL